MEFIPFSIRTRSSDDVGRNLTDSFFTFNQPAVMLTHIQLLVAEIHSVALQVIVRE